MDRYSRNIAKISRLMIQYVTKLMVSNEPLKRFHFCIEFIGHLSPWKYHEIPNVYSPNGGMPHLLFLVAMRALRIYSSLRSISSISPKEPPSIFKPKATELVTGYLLFFPQRVCHHKQRGHHHVCGLYSEYDHYPNHRVRPHILSHSAPSL